MSLTVLTGRDLRKPVRYVVFRGSVPSVSSKIYPISLKLTVTVFLFEKSENYPFVLLRLQGAKNKKIFVFRETAAFSEIEPKLIIKKIQHKIILPLLFRFSCLFCLWF